MSAPRTRERRPGDRSGERLAEDTASLATAADDLADFLPTLTDVMVRDAIADPLACVVVHVDVTGRVSRRTFLTLAAAERAVERARARGGDAAVALVRLQLVAHYAGGDAL